MRAKNMGRSELLAWINLITQSDYIKIENFSDGVGLCQVIDAFFDNVKSEMLKVKLNSKEREDWQKNFCILNEMLSKQKSFKQVDPVKLSKSNFSINFEFVQFLYDFIVKAFGTDKPKRYKGLERRIEIIKAQYGNKASQDYKKYLPSHLLTNDILLQIDKEKYFNESSNNTNMNMSIGQQQQQINESLNKEEDLVLNAKIEKHKAFFRLLEEDLNAYIEQNKSLQDEIIDGEEERQYYLDKLIEVLQFCEGKNDKKQLKQKSKVPNEIIKIIEAVPDDFN